MKNFKKYIAEGPSWGHAHNDASGGFGDPAVLTRINAYMGAIIKEDQVDSEIAVRQIRTSLSKLGLSFDEVPAFTEEKGSFELPLTLYGGRFGKDIDTPHAEFVKDDGLSHQIEGGLTLHLTYEMTDTNACRMRAQIK